MGGSTSIVNCDFMDSAELWALQMPIIVSFELEQKF
jgi:hypothetical protein